MQPKTSPDFQEFADEHARQAEFYKKDAKSSAISTFIGGAACSIATVGVINEIASDTDSFFIGGVFGVLALAMAGLTVNEFKDFRESRKISKQEYQTSKAMQNIAKTRTT